MSVNREKPHVFIVPEDDANRQLATGFTLGLDPSVSRKIQVLPEVGGWTEVLDHFNSDHTAGMETYPDRFIVLLLDFDGNEDRLAKAKGHIPPHLAERVFVLGAFTQPEALKANLGSYEGIGLALADDCRDDTYLTWQHDLLRHNAVELERLRRYVRPILFK